MTTKAWTGIFAIVGLLLIPAAASARNLSVELWTDRGSDAVYQPGNPILIKARTSDDAFLIVYEIDAEGSVHLIFPFKDRESRIEGRHTYRLPSDEQGELVVDATTGQGYIVAIASSTPFEELPWYLRPYDPQAEEVGYFGKPDEEEGITEEGRIVGDPFVAMERIRRRVLRNASDSGEFATAYTTYYVHERVRYPRYICNDCHRPGRYAWWTGFDPYYTTCSVFDFRVNWSWGWGPRYWYGSVPYFVYVYRPDCPPAYRRHSHDGGWYSSWDGWNRWCDLWGNGGLRRYKSAPPPNYVPPDRYYAAGRSPRELPPGFISSTRDKRGGIRTGVGFGVGDEFAGDEVGNSRTRGGGSDRRPDNERRREARPGERGRDLGVGDVSPTRDGRGPSDPGARSPKPSETPRFEPRRNENPASRRDENRAPVPPRFGGSRDESPSPRREEPRAPQPRPEYRAPEPRREAPAPERPRQEVRAPEPRREAPAPERPRQEYRAPDPPKSEPRQPEPARERGSRGNEGSRPAKSGEGSRKDR